MLKSSTLLLATGLALSVSIRAQAQTELNSVPQPGRPAPGAAATPPPPPPTPAAASYQTSPGPTYRTYTRPAADPSPHYMSSLSLELGWGAPYGWGITYAYQAAPSLDVNGGVGLGVGGKVGVGLRYYFLPDRAFTPYVGANLVRSGRVDNVNVDYNGETAIYSLAPSGVLHLRGGLRWQPGRVGLLSTLGYGARFTGDPVRYSYSSLGTPSQQMRDLVQIVSPGGVEFSLGIIIGLGR